MNQEQVLNEYSKNYEGTPLLISSPGRINLIGEHTDYNQGFVLPAAIDKRMFIAIAKSKDPGRANVRAVDFDQEATFNLASLHDKQSGWRGYVQVMLQELEARSYQVGRFNCVFGSSIPVGSGMSSSAALCCGFLSALNALFSWDLDKLEIAKMVSVPRSACNVLQMAAELSGSNGQNKVSGTF